jgi:hypothetical protein
VVLKSIKRIDQYVVAQCKRSVIALSFVAVAVAVAAAAAVGAITIIIISVSSVHYMIARLPIRNARLEKNLSATTALKIVEHSLEPSPGMQGFAQEAISMIASNFRTYDHEALLGLLGSQDTVSQDTLNLSNVSNISTMSSLSKLSTVMQSHARDTVS